MLLQDHMASKNYLMQETTTHSIKLIYQSLTIFLQNKVHFENFFDSWLEIEQIGKKSAKIQTGR